MRASRKSSECDSYLAAVLDAEAVNPVLEAHRHVDTCLNCQVELVRQRRLQREMALLRAPLPSGTQDLSTLVDTVLGEVDSRHARNQRRAAYLGGLAAATAGAMAIGRQIRRSAS